MKVVADEEDGFRVEYDRDDATETAITSAIESMMLLVDDLRRRGWGPEVRASNANRMRCNTQTGLELIATYAQQARSLVKLADTPTGRHLAS